MAAVASARQKFFGGTARFQELKSASTPLETTSSNFSASTRRLSSKPCLSRTISYGLSSLCWSGPIDISRQSSFATWRKDCCSKLSTKGHGVRRHWRQAAMASDGPIEEPQSTDNGSNEGSTSGSDSDNVTVGLAEQFCIIEGAETMQDFARMQLKEIKENIASRRNKIFLLMEEVRRLRIQQRLKSAEKSLQEDSEDETAYPSSIPFLPPLTKTDLRQKYYVTFFSMIGAVIVFGGFFAPVLELKLGIGGTSYADFIRSLNLPIQLSQVDPIVASFSGGAVGVLSSLMIVELNNVSLQEEKKCHYCKGSGYLACAKCGGMGAIMDPAEREQLKEQLITAGKAGGASRQVALKKLRAERCNNCSGAGKVMCPTCLCTGMALATEHDPRIDPFD